MKRFVVDELAFDVPPGARDASVTSLEWTLEDGSRIGLTLHRDTAPSRPSLANLVRDAPRQLAKRLPNFAEAPAPTVDVTFQHELIASRWRADGTVLYQVQLFMPLDDRNLILTVAGEARHREAVDELIVNAATSMSTRE